MDWSITLKKFLLMLVYTGISAALAYALQHAGDLGTPTWAQGAVTVILTALIAAVANAKKHMNDPPAKPATGGN